TPSGRTTSLRRRGTASTTAAPSTGNRISHVSMLPPGSRHPPHDQPDGDHEQAGGEAGAVVADVSGLEHPQRRAQTVDERPDAVDGPVDDFLVELERRELGEPAAGGHHDRAVEVVDPIGLLPGGPQAPEAFLEPSPHLRW